MRKDKYTVKSASGIFAQVALISIICIMMVAVLTGLTTVSNVVTIQDGDKQYARYTIYSELEDILEQQKIVLAEEDECDFTGFVNHEATLIVKRAFDVSVTADGTTKMVPTVGGTVADILDKAEIVLDQDDEVNLDFNKTVTKDDEIIVSRISYEEYQETQPIPYETIRPTAEPTVQQELVQAVPGAEGQRTITYRKKVVDGVAQEAQVISDEVTVEPVTEVFEIRNVITSELEAMVRLVSKEIGGGSFEHKQIIAEVILNRVKSPAFPNTISGVINQAGQFTGGNNYWSNRKPDESTYRAVKAALNGSNLSQGALYFYQPNGTAAQTSNWFETSLTFLFEMDGHRYFK